MKGIYVLFLEAPRCKIKIGSLGKLDFKGCYAYIGSGQRYLEKRIARHLSNRKKKHWHIDYLLDKSKIKLIMTKPSSEKCKTAELLKELTEPVKGFGCSDCDCVSHLFHLKNEKEIIAALQKFGFSFYVS